MTISQVVFHRNPKPLQFSKCYYNSNSRFKETLDTNFRESNRPVVAIHEVFKLLKQAPLGPAVHAHRFYGPVVGGVGQGTEGDGHFAIG